MWLLTVVSALAQDVVIDDPLATGSTADEVFGGTFTGSAWRVDDSNSRMHWDLGTQLAHGQVSVMLEGVTMASLDGSNMHVIELFDEGGHWSSHRAVNVRIYGALEGPDQQGQVKLKCWDPNGVVEARFGPIDWDGSPYLMTVVWDENHCAVYRNGEELLNLETGGLDLRVGSLWLPLNDWVYDYSAPIGSSYHDLHLEGWEPGASDPPPDDGNPLTFTPAADVPAVAWAPDANQARNEDLSVEADAGPPSAISYLMFDLSSLTGPIASATLTLRSRTDGSAEGDGGGIYAVGTDWAEDGVTWNARPALGVRVASFPYVTPDQTYTIDVSGAVAQAGGPVALALVPEGPNGAHFSSKEDDNGNRAAVLTVVMGDTTGTDDPPPEDTGDTPPADEDPHDPPDEDAPAADDPAYNSLGGCGCDGTGGTGGPAGFFLIGAVLLRRRANR